MASCSAVKAGAKKDEGGEDRVMATIFPLNHYKQCFPQHLLVNGKQQINSLLSLACVFGAFTFTRTQTMSSCAFTFSVLSTEESEEAAAWC